jgi:hypothetical protein
MPYKDASVKKAKHAQYSRNHYIDNQAEIKKRNAATRKRRREEWQKFKSSLACTKCNFSHSAALDFHHENPSQKTGNVHHFAANGQYKKAYEEIKKCIVLCANCHRIHHYEENLLNSTQ